MGHSYPSSPAAKTTTGHSPPVIITSYHTVTDSIGNATYYQVVDKVPINPVGTVTIRDNASDAVITANPMLAT